MGWRKERWTCIWSKTGPQSWRWTGTVSKTALSGMGIFYSSVSSNNCSLKSYVKQTVPEQLLQLECFKSDTRSVRPARRSSVNVRTSNGGVRNACWAGGDAFLLRGICWSASAVCVLDIAGDCSAISKFQTSWTRLGLAPSPLCSKVVLMKKKYKWEYKKWKK